MKTNLNIEIVDIRGDGFHIFIPALINTQSVKLLIDTGASRTVFDMDALKNILGKDSFDENEQKTTGLGTTDMQSFFAIIDELQLGDVALNSYQAVLLDLAHVNNSYSNIGLSPIIGIIGGDILMKYRAVIDYKKQQLSLYQRKKAIRS